MNKRGVSSFVWYLIAIVFSLAVFGVGIYLVVKPPYTWAMLAAGCACLVAVGVSLPIAFIVQSQNAMDREEVYRPVTERLDQIALLLNLINEQAQLSDRAKMVAFREKDREALRRAVQEETGRQDWEAAMSLTDEIERAFGYKLEADRLRADISAKQLEAEKKVIAEAVTVIDKHTRVEQWNQAIREAEKLIQELPHNEQVKNLPLEIDVRRQTVKKQLRGQWDEAVARHDVDGSIEILKRLDPYLTPAEAEAMQETARGIFKEKLNNLSAMFGAAVHEERWRDAAQIGEAIITDFPNSRIAQEIRDNLPTLRQRAGEPATANA